MTLFAGSPLRFGLPLVGLALVFVLVTQAYGVTSEWGNDPVGHREGPGNMALGSIPTVESGSNDSLPMSSSDWEAITLSVDEIPDSSNPSQPESGKGSGRATLALVGAGLLTLGRNRRS